MQLISKPIRPLSKSPNPHLCAVPGADVTDAGAVSRRRPRLLLLLILLDQICQVSGACRAAAADAGQAVPPAALQRVGRVAPTGQRSRVTLPADPAAPAAGTAGRPLPADVAAVRAGCRRTSGVDRRPTHVLRGSAHVLRGPAYVLRVAAHVHRVLTAVRAGSLVVVPLRGAAQVRVLLADVGLHVGDLDVPEHVLESVHHLAVQLLRVLHGWAAEKTRLAHHCPCLTPTVRHCSDMSLTADTSNHHEVGRLSTDPARRLCPSCLAAAVPPLVSPVS